MRVARIICIALLVAGMSVTSGQAGEAESGESGHLVCESVWQATAGPEQTTAGDWVTDCRWQEGSGEKEKAPKTDCDDLDITVQSEGKPRDCRANCQACDLTAAQQARVDRFLDQACSKTCADFGKCPPGKECVLDAVANKVNYKTCMPRSRQCANAQRPAYCLVIGRIGDCTCKCV